MRFLGLNTTNLKGSFGRIGIDKRHVLFLDFVKPDCAIGIDFQGKNILTQFWIMVIHIANNQTTSIWGGHGLKGRIYISILHKTFLPQNIQIWICFCNHKMSSITSVRPWTKNDVLHGTLKYHSVFIDVHRPIKRRGLNRVIQVPNDTILRAYLKGRIRFCQDRRLVIHDCGPSQRSFV